MSDGTHIEWADATLNVVNGCTVVSPGCENCYAMRLAATRLQHHPSRAGLARMHNGHPQWTGEVRFNEKVLLEPLRWRRPRKIFWNAHGDLFHDAVPDEWIDRCFAVMALTPHHIHQVLTKRPGRMRAYVMEQRRGRPAPRVAQAALRLWEQGLQRLSGSGYLAIPGSPFDTPNLSCWHLPNVWLGVSVEDQKRADERIPILLDTPAAVRWLSCEPLLGPVDLKHWAYESFHEPGIAWIVAGGESGPGARPMHPDWARSLRDQCAAAGVPFLFKQWGNWKPLAASDGYWPADAHHCIRLTPEGQRSDGGWPMQRLAKHIAGRVLDGVQHDGYPS